MTTPANIAERLKDEEGWRPHVYSDSLGYASIGFGFLIDSRRGEGLPKEVAEFWLAYNIRKIEAALTDRWMPFQAQPPDVRECLVEMAYNLGIDGLMNFKNMLAALAMGDRAKASTEALDSKWAGQVKSRANRIAARLAGGK